MRLQRFVIPVIFLSATIVSAKLRTTTRPSHEDAEAVKAGLHAYNKHMLAGDAKAMIEDQHATTENGKKMAEATAQSDAAVGRLERVVQRKWGDEPRNWVAATIGDATDEVADGADVIVDRDKATVHFKSGGGGPMIKVDGKWMIDADAQANDAGDIDAACENLKKREATARQAAAEVRAGKYSTVDELVGALRVKNPE